MSLRDSARPAYLGRSFFTCPCRTSRHAASQTRPNQVSHTRWKQDSFTCSGCTAGVKRKIRVARCDASTGSCRGGDSEARFISKKPKQLTLTVWYSILWGEKKMKKEPSGSSSSQGQLGMGFRRCSQSPFTTSKRRRGLVIVSHFFFFYLFLSLHASIVNLYLGLA